MTLTLRPYPSYANSGFAWLCDVPSHWEVVPNRALFAEVVNQNHPDEALLSVTIGRGVIQQEGQRLIVFRHRLLRATDVAQDNRVIHQGTAEGCWRGVPFQNGHGCLVQRQRFPAAPEIIEG